MDQVEVEKLKEEYTLKQKNQNEEDAKALDRKVKVPCYAFTYTYGVLGALILGVGMCLAMKVIGDGSMLMMVLGIIIGLVGIAMVSTNYPIYKAMLRSRKEKYAAQILLLLSKEE